MYNYHPAPWTSRPGNRRSTILLSAATLFAAQGVAATSVRQIADRAGILSGSLYHHFASKEAIVDAIIRPYLDELCIRYRNVLADNHGAREQLRGLIRASLVMAAAQPHATEIYQNEFRYLIDTTGFEYLRSVGTQVQATWLAVITQGIRDGEFRKDVAPGVCYRLIRDAVWMTVGWFAPSPDYPLSRLVDECAGVFLSGLMGPGAPGCTPPTTVNS
jgi:AcrR family transcriptional regulator